MRGLMLHPEFAARDERLRYQAECEGMTVWHISTVRTYDEQLVLYNRYLAGIGNQAAAPWASYNYQSPWGWLARGSLHMVQADGYGHAIDYGLIGDWNRFHEMAAFHGIGFPVPGERWHAQWWDHRGIYQNHLPPAPQPPKEEDDMAAFLIQPDDGDIAVFTTDGVTKAWVRDGYALVSLRASGIVKAALDSSPIKLSRSAIDSLKTVGPLPQYDPTYTGPRTTV